MAVYRRLTAFCVFFIVCAFTACDCTENDDSMIDTATSHPNVTSTIVPLVTLQPSNSTKDEAYIGFIAATVACVFFGTNLVPVKRIDTGDGKSFCHLFTAMFFQWVFCSAVWCVGLVVNVIQGYPKFYPISMLGGFIWCTGNVVVVPVLKTIGLGMGMLFWGSANLLTGWFSGRFGWFGLRPQDRFTRPALDYVGVALGFLRLVLFSFVKSDVMDRPMVTERSPLLSGETTEGTINTKYERDTTFAREESDHSWVDNLSPVQKRILGILMALFAGCMYGLNFAPVLYAQQHYDGATDNGLDYVFAHYSGIYATSTLYFILYAMYMKNKPKVFPRAILPTLLSGAMWGVAQTAWFVANQRLQESISFPIITTGPTLIGALWSVLYFREIKGTRNLLVLVVAMVVTITGAVLTGLSY
ncbi:transmembrane protein 144-like [Branchiostoma lanceolatum]|uniref:transmembrane protein 144-like n=1 Tax=Branchiostoma lanceolatum TaxID=7740 RepID=UPI003453E634